jgi:hypothetical protein
MARIIMCFTLIPLTLKPEKITSTRWRLLLVEMTIGKSDLTIDNSGTLDPDIGRSFIV